MVILGHVAVDIEELVRWRSGGGASFYHLHSGLLVSSQQERASLQILSQPRQASIKLPDSRCAIKLSQFAQSVACSAYASTRLPFLR